MPIDRKQLRERAEETNHLNGEAREILDFLGKNKDQAFTFKEITDGVVTVRGTQALLPWNPVLVGMRTFTLGAALDELNRSGLVIRSRDGVREWYHLPK